MKEISVIVPLYNEEPVLRESYDRLKGVLDGMGAGYEIVFVNDGSRDKTEEMALEIVKGDKNVRLINFARNFGHQVAITAGMDEAVGMAVVVIDADLQDPPEVIPKMMEKWREGYEVVYGKRLKREGETFLKKLTAKLFYRLLKSLTNVDIPVDTGDFRLIDRKVCDVMCRMREQNRYVRGLISFAGFQQIGVEYIRHERFAGETKYSLKKMLKLALDGITSFSAAPLRLALHLGTTLCVGTVIFFIVKAFLGQALGALGISTLLLVNGFVLICLGLMGEYISRIYDECRARPIYIIKNKAGFDGDENN